MSKPSRSRPPGRRSWAWRWRRVLFLFGLGLFTAIAGLLFVLAQVPLPDEGPQAETTILTDIGGARLASFDSGENRVLVDLSAVPEVVVDAVLATEDRSFYSHAGLDPVGIARAAAADVRGGRLQGGSTITQQYVKATYLGRERSLWRKLREAALALKVERTYDKDEILQRYLNTVYFGRGAYGVQAASRAWFRKDVGELALSEAAYLAGLIRAPEDADAERHPAEAKRRRDRTLAAMVEVGAVTDAQARRAGKVELPTFVLTRDAQEPTVVGAAAGTQYFVEFVRAELVRRYGADATYQGGLRVRTSLDPKLQADAYRAVHGLLDKPDTDPAAAMVAVDDQGRVRAMVGGRDFAGSKVNYAVGREGGGSGRQAGSTFKPFLLGALVKDGWSVQSAFPAPPTVILPRADRGRDYPVENYELADFGPSLSMVDATANSVNTVYVQAQLALGSQKVVDFAHAAGIGSPLDATASLTLGTEEVSVLEMASAYSTFANRGVRVAPRTILAVQRSDGTELESERPPLRTRVLAREQADVVTHCLRQVVVRGSGGAARVPATPVAGKTGTTQLFGDAWFVGYTPKLTAAVWMGYPEGPTRPMTSVRGREVNGGSFPAQIFRRFMVEATEDPQWRGDFVTATRFRGRTLTPPTKVVIPTTTTTSTTPAAPPPAPPPGAPGADSSSGTQSTTTQPQPPG